MELEVIYQNIERRDEDEDDYVNEDKLGPGKRSHRPTEPKAPNHRGSSCFAVSTVCLGLICVLLLIAILVQQMKISSEREIKLNYTNMVEELKIEKDQLQISFNSLDQKKLELETRVNRLTIEKDQLQSRFNSLNQKKLELESRKKTVWFFISSEEKSWYESRQFCRDLGGDLIIINTEEEQRYVSSLVKEIVWIGLSDIENEGNMKWVDNSPLKKGFWDTNEPNDKGGNEDCVEVNSAKPFQSNWNDLPCSEKRKWICEN